MLENQFINIGSPYPDWSGNALPCPITSSVFTGYSYEIYVEGDVTSIAVLKENGQESSVGFEASSTAYASRDIGLLLYNGNISEGERFMLKTYKGNVAYRYSKPLIRVPNDIVPFSHIRYRCNEDAFGFPFSDGSYVSFYLPLRLHSPQNVQDDKTYVKANGEVVTLFAKYYKEWEGETEYLSAEMHDKIVAALSCDEVYINGKRVTKSDKYQVDWENYDLDCDGVTKLARATFKVRENTNQRNSNF